MMTDKQIKEAAQKVSFAQKVDAKKLGNVLFPDAPDQIYLVQQHYATGGIAAGLNYVFMDFGDFAVSKSIEIVGFKFDGIRRNAGSTQWEALSGRLRVFGNGYSVNKDPGEQWNIPDSTIENYQEFTFVPAGDVRRCNIRLQAGMQQFAMTVDAFWQTASVLSDVVIANLSIYYKLF